MFMYMHVHVHVYYPCTCTCMYRYMHVHVHAHTYMHVHVHVIHLYYIYQYTCIQFVHVICTYIGKLVFNKVKLLIHYVLSLSLCTDINECLVTHTHGCSHNCVNTIGSYRCECPLDSGLRLGLDGQICEQSKYNN